MQCVYVPVAANLPPLQDETRNEARGFLVEIDRGELQGEGRMHGICAKQQNNVADVLVTPLNSTAESPWSTLCCNREGLAGKSRVKSLRGTLIRKRYLVQQSN